MSTCIALPRDSRNETINPPEQLVVRTQEDKLRKLNWNLEMFTRVMLDFYKEIRSYLYSKESLSQTSLWTLKIYYIY
jgi:hypothetical protein